MAFLRGSVQKAWTYSTDALCHSGPSLSVQNEAAARAQYLL